MDPNNVMSVGTLCWTVLLHTMHLDLCIMQYNAQTLVYFTCNITPHVLPFESYLHVQKHE
jgi:hypothetical protein